MTTEVAQDLDRVKTALIAHRRYWCSGCSRYRAAREVRLELRVLDGWRHGVYRITPTCSICRLTMEPDTLTEVAVDQLLRQHGDPGVLETYVVAQPAPIVDPRLVLDGNWHRLSNLLGYQVCVLSVRKHCERCGRPVSGDAVRIGRVAQDDTGFHSRSTYAHLRCAGEAIWGYES